MYVCVPNLTRHELRQCNTKQHSITVWMQIACTQIPYLHPYMLQTDGAFYFSGSKLLQPGSFDPAGLWVAAAGPAIGSTQQLRALAAS